MFEGPVVLTDLNMLRNLSEVEYIKLIKDAFKKSINELTVQDKGDTETGSSSQPTNVSSAQFDITGVPQSDRPCISVFAFVPGVSESPLPAPVVCVS